MCFFIFRSSLFGGPCQLLPCRFVCPREEGESDDICFSFHLFFSAPYSTKFSVSSLHTIIGSYFHLPEKEKNFEQKISNTIFHFHIIPAIVFVTCTMKYVTAISLSSFVIFLHDPLNYLLFFMRFAARNLYPQSNTNNNNNSVPIARVCAVYIHMLSFVVENNEKWK